MGKKKSKKKEERASKRAKLELDRKVESAVNQALAEDVETGKLPAPGSLRIDPEHLPLLNDFAGPKPKPPKKKTLYSGKVPPVPPPPLLDLIHNFLKDFKYIKAAHGMRTDNQKRPGHNMNTWKWTSDGMPDLLELFLQWQEQNPGRGTALTGDDPTPKRTEGMALGVYGAEPQYLSRAAYMRAKKSTDEPSDSEADQVKERHGSSDIDTDFLPLSQPSNGLKRKASELDDNSDSGSAATSEDSDNGSESDSSASSSSSSDDTTSREISSKRKFGAAPESSGKSKRAKKNSSKSSSSSSSSDADELETQSNSKNSDKQTQPPVLNGSESSETLASPTMVVDAEQASNGIRKTSSGKKSSSSASSSSSDSNSSSSDPESQSGSSGSKSSSDSKSSESSSSDSDEEDTTHPERKSRVPKPKKDLLVYHEPLSKKARGRGETLGEQKTVEATAQNFKMLKKKHVPFSRIPSDVRVEDKFSSNAYIPYDYANKAYQDLSVTKGKAFTKAKNKGKRGSYKGGLIDTTARGIKFDD